jgi:hypothetical protein
MKTLIRGRGLQCPAPPPAACSPPPAAAASSALRPRRLPASTAPLVSPTGGQPATPHRLSRRRTASTTHRSLPFVASPICAASTIPTPRTVRATDSPLLSPHVVHSFMLPPHDLHFAWVSTHSMKINGEHVWTLCRPSTRVHQSRVAVPDADHITAVGFSCSLLLLCTYPISGKVLLLICKKKTLLIFELAKHHRCADLHHQQCVCGVSERRNQGTIRATPTPASAASSTAFVSANSVQGTIPPSQSLPPDRVNTHTYNHCF